MRASSQEILQVSWDDFSFSFLANLKHFRLAVSSFKKLHKIFMTDDVMASKSLELLSLTLKAQVLPGMEPLPPQCS